MVKILKYGLLVVIATILFTGCGRTGVIQNVDNSQFFNKSVKSANLIARAIKSGAMRKGWRTRKVRNGLIVASITVRGKYFVAVNINYDAKGYVISYKNSRNMKYDPVKKTIHPSYNKWVRILEQNINYELSNLGMDDTPMVSQKIVKTKTYKKGAKLNLNGKTIYIKPMVRFAPRSRVASNIKTECTLPKALADSIVEYSANSGVNVVFKNHIKPNELELKVQIEEAISAGNAAIGHNKFVVISGGVVKGKTKYYSFDAARRSGGGYWGAYRSSCSVLGRIARALGKDVAHWLANPYDKAMMGDTQFIRK